MEPPGFREAPGRHGERCIDCKFMEWRESKPHCGKSDFPLMHWYHCDDWESDGKFAPIRPSSEGTVRYVNRERHGE